MKNNLFQKSILSLACIACMAFSISPVRAEEPPEPSSVHEVKEEQKDEQKKENKEEKAELPESMREESQALEEGQKSEEIKEYDVWVSGIRVTDRNRNDILGDQTAFFEETTSEERTIGVLTLDGADLEIADLSEKAGEAISAAVYAKDDLMIRLASDSSIHLSSPLPENQPAAGIRLTNERGGKSVYLDGRDQYTLSIHLLSPANSAVTGISVSDGRDVNSLSLYHTGLSVSLHSQSKAASQRGIECEDIGIKGSDVIIYCADGEELVGISAIYVNIDETDLNIVTGKGDAGIGIHTVSGRLQSGIHIYSENTSVRIDATDTTSGVGAYGEEGSELLTFDTSALEVSGSDTALHFDEIHDKDGRGALMRRTLSNEEIPETFEGSEMTFLSDQYRYVCIPKDRRNYIVTHADPSWYKNSGKPARFVWKNEEEDTGTFSHFAALMFDDTKLDEHCYFAEEGSLKITLLPSFLETLTQGTHKVQAIFSDGLSETAEFELLQKKPEPKPDSDSDSDQPSPGTGSARVTCQMAGFPEGYVWNEAAKACQPGILDQAGNFHAVSSEQTPAKYRAVSTGDKGINGHAVTLISALITAAWSGCMLKNGR
ncbi:MAG: hypothetical protein IKD66_12605 [Solobacterium sp.]|nr:hypothetical protein [Solobacterium sp.]